MTIKFGPDLSYFLWSLAVGLFLALVYDVIKTARRLIKTSDIVVNAVDIVFLIFSGVVMTSGAYLVNNGELRIYSFLSIVGVFALYRFVVGSRVVDFLTMACRALEQAVIWVIKIAFIPIKLIAKALRVILKPLGKIIHKSSRIIHIKKKG